MSRMQIGIDSRPLTTSMFGDTTPVVKCSCNLLGNSASSLFFEYTHKAPSAYLDLILGLGCIQRHMNSFGALRVTGGKLSKCNEAALLNSHCTL